MGFNLKNKAELKRMLSRGGASVDDGVLENLPSEGRQNHEAQIQMEVISWARSMEKRYPALRLLHATPNETAAGDSERIYKWRMGAKGGVPDLNLPVGRLGYIGLWIEHKYEGNKLTDNQRNWKAMLEEENHLVVTSYSARSSIGIICEYLDIPKELATT